MFNKTEQKNEKQSLTKKPTEIEVRFSDNTRYRIGVSFIVNHYLKKNQINAESKKGEIEKLYADTDKIINYAGTMNWGVVSMSAFAIQDEEFPDYEKQWADKANKKLIY